MKIPKAFLFDLDGTIVDRDRPVEGALELLEKLRAMNIPFLIVTNTSRKSSFTVAYNLRKLGFRINSSEIFTALTAAKIFLQTRSVTRVKAVLTNDSLREFEGFLFSSTPEALVVGDIGNSWNFDILNETFNVLLKHSPIFVATHKNRFWKTSSGPTLDLGPFVVALEYASGKKATVVGKPSNFFYTLAAKKLGVEKEDIVMVGDDLESDVKGALDTGIEAIAVETGKYKFQRNVVSITPPYVISSVKEILDILEKN